MPIGTGPFMVTGFTVNDTVSMAANPNYRDPAKPAFATAVIKGGGDAEGSARAVMETGEFDYAWNTQIPPDSQAAMAAAGKGQFVVAFGTLVERIEMNMTDPSADLPEGERSTAKHPHPILSDIKVRTALSMAIDRSILVEVGYGAGGSPTCNVVPAPAGLGLRQHRLPRAGHGRRQGAAGRSGLDRQRRRRHPRQGRQEAARSCTRPPSTRSARTSRR